VHVDPDLLQLYRKTLTRSQSYDFWIYSYDASVVVS
jgi:hypothetical protein